MRTLGIGLNGLRVLMRCHPAFHDRRTGEWDIASSKNHGAPYRHENPWAADEAPLEEPIMNAWRRLPPANQAWFMVVPELSYDRILEIDELGDRICALPVVFAEFPGGELPTSPTAEIYFEKLGLADRATFHPNRQVCVFPDEFKDMKWEAPWRARNGSATPKVAREITLEDGSVWSPVSPAPRRSAEPFYVPPDEE